MTKIRKNKRIDIWDEKFRFMSYFDSMSGGYIRTGIFDHQGKESDADPFMASFPHLIDVGIMGHCAHGLSGRCKMTHVQCYQSGATIDKPNMTFDDYKTILAQCEGKVFQFALGGRGDPDMHEKFEDILDFTRSYGIVPNLTTSGYQLTREKAKIIKKYCGAAAVSWYKTDYTQKAIELLLDEGVKTNIHFVLGGNTLADAMEILEQDKIPKGINRIIFLLFKPVGQGSVENVLEIKDNGVMDFFKLIDKPENINKTGFDSCTIPALVNYSKNMDPRSYDCCEGGRFSAYITPDMKMLPCSFDQTQTWAVDLRETSINGAWESEKFENFRDRLRTQCEGCPKHDLCMGGCPIRREIVLCSDIKNFQNSSGRKFI